MRLLISSPSFYPAFYYGGPIYATHKMAEGLSKDIEVFVSTTDANGNAKLKTIRNKYLIQKNNLSIKYYSSYSKHGISLFMMIGLIQDIYKSDLIYIVSLFSISSIVTLLYCKILNRKVLFSPRGQLSSWALNQGNSFKALWVKYLFRPFAGNIFWHFTSPKERDEVLACCHKIKYCIIPNGLEIPIRKANKNKNHYRKYSDKILSDSRIIISMGRLHKVKGFDILIDAFKSVKEIHSNALLFIAGEDFGEKENLEAKIKDLSLQDSIFLIGLITGDEKTDFLANADVFVLPSHSENFGIVYAESLANGTPIVASTNTPWIDVQKHNCGMCVPNSASDFTNAMLNILKSDTVEMGICGIKYISTFYSWERITNQMKKAILSIYQMNQIKDYE